MKEGIKNSVFNARHAESLANAGEAFSDPRGIPLTSRGERQAALLAQEIYARGIKPELIVVSDTTRSQRTAQPTIQRFPFAPVEVWDIHEFEYLNSFSGKESRYQDRKAVRDAFWERSDPDYRDSGEGSETFREFISRVDMANDRLKDIDQTTVVFSHGYVMKATNWRLEGNGQDITSEAMQSFRDYVESHPIDNTSLHTLDLAESRWSQIYTPQVARAT